MTVKIVKCLSLRTSKVHRDEHGCNLDNFQHWCDITSSCLRKKEVCPECDKSYCTSGHIFHKCVNGKLNAPTRVSGRCGYVGTTTTISSTTSNAIVNSGDVIDAHKCNLTAGQHWCDVTSSCLANTYTCPECITSTCSGIYFINCINYDYQNPVLVDGKCGYIAPTSNTVTTVSTTVYDTTSTTDQQNIWDTENIISLPVTTLVGIGVVVLVGGAILFGRR